MSHRSRRPLQLTAAALAVACAAGGAVAATHSRQAHRAALAAYGAPAVRPATGAAPASAAAAAAPAAADAVAATPANAKKGVSAWAFPGSRIALKKSGVSWYYTWAPNHNGIITPRGVRFVPMIWGGASVTTSQLQQAKAAGSVMLTFNEPDNAGQSNMTPQQALNLWPQLMRTGMRLSSPAVAAGGADPGGWLDTFMKGAAARHDRVSFIALHWYGGNFDTAQAVSELKSYLQAVWNRYHKGIWLTEFALIRFGATSTFPTPARQAAFVTAATRMLEQLPYVWRYAWFALPKSAGDGSTGLYANGAVPTSAGRAFAKVDA